MICVARNIRPNASKPMNARLTAWLNNESPMAINNKEIIDN